MAHLRLVVCLLLCLTFLNLLFIYSYIFSSNKSKSYEICTQDATPNKINKNQISLTLNIMDMYRLDVSCDYITRDLGEKISNQYVNYKKRCSFSSLNSNINSKVQESRIQINLVSYEPNINKEPQFEPFNETSQKNEFVFKDLKPGGVWHPQMESKKPCNIEDIDNVVFIVPFSRSRIENLKFYLTNIHSYLQNNTYPFKYRILIAEQLDMESKFNKGRIINTAVKHVIENYNKEDLVDCIVIHDVDLIPTFSSEVLKELGDYRCRKMPWHLSNKVYNLKINKERIYNQFLTGGILSLRLDHFIKVNGFSNEYFGWGAEDDDFQIRMFSSGLCIMRPKLTNEKAPFTMLPHASSGANNERFSILSTALLRQNQDGLSNIKQLSKIVNVKFFKSFTYLAIKVLN